MAEKENNYYYDDTRFLVGLLMFELTSPIGDEF
jgi:hypothetical protein